jgi:hypothetical protein
VFTTWRGPILTHSTFWGQSDAPFSSLQSEWKALRSFTPAPRPPPFQRDKLHWLTSQWTSITLNQSCTCTSCSLNRKHIFKAKLSSLRNLRKQFPSIAYTPSALTMYKYGLTPTSRSNDATRPNAHFRKANDDWLPQRANVCWCLTDTSNRIGLHRETRGFCTHYPP